MSSLVQNPKIFSLFPKKLARIQKITHFKKLTSENLDFYLKLIIKIVESCWSRICVFRKIPLLKPASRPRSVQRDSFGSSRGVKGKFESTTVRKMQKRRRSPGGGRVQRFHLNSVNEEPTSEATTTNTNPTCATRPLARRPCLSPRQPQCQKQKKEWTKNSVTSQTRHKSHVL